MVANIDLAPTFLDLAGLPVPESMQGRSLAPLLRGESPSDWRKSVYYRYYHDPGHHNTAAHLGVRTETHKLIYYWKLTSMNSSTSSTILLSSRTCCSMRRRRKEPAVAAKFEELKAEIAKLQKQYKDDGQFADPNSWPQGGADGPFDDKKPTGTKSISEAIQMAAQS